MCGVAFNKLKYCALFHISKFAGSKQTTTYGFSTNCQIGEMHESDTKTGLQHRLNRVTFYGLPVFGPTGDTMEVNTAFTQDLKCI
jgi:hypothetical protein